MRITFAYPDFESLGVEYLMAVAERAGHQVELILYHARDNFINLGAGRNQTAVTVGAIAATRPDMVCLSCVTDNYQSQLQCAKALRDLMPRAITLFGGIHVTAVPELVIQEDCVDAVAVGEAEVSFGCFLDACGQGDGVSLPKDAIPGVVFKRAGQLIGEFREGPLADLDSLPRPYKEPYLSVLPESGVNYSIMTSRGCPYGCAYCFNAMVHQMRGRRLIRQRSIQNVLDELAEAKAKHHIRYVSFSDDSFTTNKVWLLDFLAQYNDRIGLPFSCIANPHYIDQAVATALGKGGCRFVQLGVQSLAQDLNRDILLRSTKRERVAHALDALRREGLMVQVDHMLGIPHDTIENQESSALFYNQHRPHIISVFWLTYYPRTPILKTAMEAGELSSNEVDRLEHGFFPALNDLHAGGSCKHPEPFYAIHVLLNYLPLLPRFLVDLLIRRRWYRVFAIKNRHAATTLPRIVVSLDRRYFWGRMLIRSFLRKIGQRLHVRSRGRA